MTSRIDTIIEGVLAREAGYVVHPSDRGGPTNWGITQTVARLNGYAGDMRAMPAEVARQIYRRRYILEPRFDLVLAASVRIGEEVVDTGVNMGPAVAAVFLQRWLNGFNLRGRIYSDLFVDGRVGPVTAEALRAFVRHRGAEGEAVMVAALNSVQGGRYLEISERDANQEDFLYGWVRARVLQPAGA